MNVLSLFDGISCAYEALLRSQIKINTYYAAEIDKNAIKVSEKNHPDIFRLGNVKDIKGDSLPKIDLLIGGSPCQDLSIAKKDRKGLEGDKSSLFWDYVRLLHETKPKYFILENVASMPQKDKDIITETMGVEPVMFNASLVSAQNRKRYFWTNIKFDLPEDRGIKLKDILQPDAEVDTRFVTNGKSFCLTSSYSKLSASANQIEYKAKTKQRTMVKLGHIGNSNSQANRVYDPSGKSVTLSANGGGLGAKTGLYIMGEWKPATYPIHVPQGTSTEPIRVGHEQRRKLKDGKRADNDESIEAIRRIETRNDDKCGTLTTIQKDNHVVNTISNKIRKLTPIECERLQGLPDNYTEGVAMTHRYKCLGNAFHVDVVAHILMSVRV